MLRSGAIALAVATVLSAAPVSAQTFELGPRGPSIDLRSDRQRERDFRREEAAREREFERREQRRAERRMDREYSTGSVRCREITIRERDDFGRMVTRTRRDC